jgi:hypothetical protein
MMPGIVLDSTAWLKTLSRLSRLAMVPPLVGRSIVWRRAAV